MQDNKVKGLLPVIVVALAAAVIGFSLIKSAAREKSLRIQKETELSIKINELGKKETQIAELVKQKDALEAEAKTHAAALDSLTKDYEGKMKGLSDNVEALSKDNELMSRQREVDQRQIAELSAKIQSLGADRAALEQKIRQLETARNYAAQQSGEGEEESSAVPEDSSDAGSEPVELGSIVVQRSSGQAAQVQHFDKVYGFVIINAGAKDGLTKDTVVNITRKDKLIAKAVVEKVKDGVSAAVLLPEFSRGDVKEGDAVAILS